MIENVVSNEYLKGLANIKNIVDQCVSGWPAAVAIIFDYKQENTSIYAEI